MPDDLQIFDLVLFGGTGDLVTRKLLPALYHAYSHQTINQNGRFFVIGRREMSKEEYCTCLLYTSPSPRD